jgi:hypothetical protein
MNNLTDRNNQEADKDPCLASYWEANPENPFKPHFIKFRVEPYILQKQYIILTSLVLYVY